MEIHKINPTECESCDLQDKCPIYHIVSILGAIYSQSFREMEPEDIEAGRN